MMRGIELFSKVLARSRIALFHPQPEPFPIHVLRTILLRRRVFDIFSLVIQIRDIRRLIAIPETSTVSGPVDENAYAHNAGVTLDKIIVKTRRMEELFRIVATIRRNLESATLLCVGPRTIHELYVAWLHGFAWINIHGIDLYSTNKKIQVMDMEHMRFADGSFDVVIMSNTLSYARDVRRCISEVARVLRPEGLFCFTAVYCPDNKRFEGDSITGAEIAGLLKENDLSICHYAHRERVNSLSLRQATHVICASKRSPNARPFDLLQLSLASE